MSDDLTDMEMVARYLDGELTDAERIEFESQLASSPELRRQLEQVKGLTAAVAHYGLTKTVAGLHQQMMNEVRPDIKKTPVIPIILRRAFQVAASIIIIVIAFAMYQYYSVSAEKLYANNYKPYAIEITRGDTGGSELVDTYADRKYAQVIKLYKQLNAPAIKDHFLAGQSYLATGAPNLAIPEFQQVLFKNKLAHSGTLRDDAEYFLALSYLKANKIEEARPLFEKIYLSKEHLYHDKVTSRFMWQLRLLDFKR